uniref:TSA: Wollemia nobilis Ref_Wollemi_Transcript_5741_1644 transcribed RNA sequence n=1 Tax=Wollemia nobilis TaxID=56998 RepID=A0A0C9RPC7_9CONI
MSDFRVKIRLLIRFGCSFGADLSAKMAEILGSSVLLKCQLPTQDLDALVSIKSDEDLENILEEYDRLAAKEGSSKVRAFLFPKPCGPSKAAPLGNGHMVARGGGPVDHEPERAIVQSHDEGANGGYVAGSIPPEPYRPPQISQEPQGLDKSNAQSNIPLAFKPRGSSHPSQQKQHAHDMSHKAGRPPRCPPVHPDAQYNSPVRYAIRSATQIHDRVKMPPQQKYAARAAAPACVDDGQFVRVDQSSFARVVYSGNNHRYISPSPPPPAQVQFPGKAAKIPKEHARKAYQYILHNPYSQEGGGLQGFRACEQFLVQH